MRQMSLFEFTPASSDSEAVGLAGLMPAVRAAMNRVAGSDPEGRKLLVDKINAVASREAIALTRSGAKSISKPTLDKWLQTSDKEHTPSLEGILCFCLAAGDASPIKPFLSCLGLVAISEEDLGYVRLGKAQKMLKNAKEEFKKAEAGV